MLYENYKNKIERIAKIRDFIIKYRAIFITILAIILAGVIALLSYIGSFTSPLTCNNNVVYGNSVQCTQEAFLSNVTYEYKINDTWQTEKPIYPGEYLVRGVSKNGFGFRRYSEETTFKIIPKNVDLFVKNQKTTYGDKPILYGNLINGDKVEGGTFDYIDKVISLSLATPICAVLKLYYQEKQNPLALDLANYIQFGTIDETEIWLLKYGFSADDFEWLVPCIETIDENQITFKNIDNLSEEQKGLLERYL
jgi:hypothetical protein